MGISLKGLKPAHKRSREATPISSIKLPVANFIDLSRKELSISILASLLTQPAVLISQFHWPNGRARIWRGPFPGKATPLLGGTNFLAPPAPHEGLPHIRLLLTSDTTKEVAMIGQVIAESHEESSDKCQPIAEQREQGKIIRLSFDRGTILLRPGPMVA